MSLRLRQALDFYLGGLLILVLRPVVVLVGWLLRRDHATDVRGDICILKLLGGGSLLLALPALLGLRRRWPGHKLLLVCTPAVAPFAKTLRVFDELIVIDDSGPLRLALSGLRAWRRCLGVDTLIDLEVYSRLSTIFSVLTGARNRIGFFLHEVFWRRGLHTQLIFFNRFSGSWHFYERAVLLLGASPASAEDCRQHLQAGLPPTPNRAEATICVGSGTSELAPERMLTVPQWEAVFRDRAGKSAARRFVFLGAARDRELAAATIQRLEQSLPGRSYENRCGELSLDESLSELARASEFWGVDSALLHYARIFGVHCVSYWGPTDPRTRLKPVPGLTEDVLYEKIPCSPCIHLAEEAPCRGNNLCIKNLFRPPGDLPEWPL